MYLHASGYVPADPHNFLKNWNRSADGQWLPNPADANKPVVHVSLKEARLFCAHYGKRLPHTWEWSHAAQGSDGRVFPWGDEAGEGTRCPALDTDSRDDRAGLHDVGAFPSGASPFGVLDLVGNVCMWT